MLGNGKSEIDVEIKGHDIPKFTWFFIGVAILLISVGICISFIIRGSIGVSRAQAETDRALQEAQFYSEKLLGVENE